MTKDVLLEALLHIQVLERVLKNLAAEHVDARSRAEERSELWATVQLVLVDEAGAA